MTIKRHPGLCNVLPGRLISDGDVFQEWRGSQASMGNVLHIERTVHRKIP